MKARKRKKTINRIITNRIAVISVLSLIVLIVFLAIYTYRKEKSELLLKGNAIAYEVSSRIKSDGIGDTEEDEVNEQSILKVYNEEKENIDKYFMSVCQRFDVDRVYLQVANEDYSKAFQVFRATKDAFSVNWEKDKPYDTTEDERVVFAGTKDEGITTYKGSNSHTYMAFLKRVSNKNGKTVAVVGIAYDLVEINRKFIIGIVRMSVVFLLIIGIMIISIHKVIEKRVLDRIVKISDYLANFVSDEVLQYKLIGDNGDDEISLMGQNYDIMIQRIQDYIQKITVMEEEKERIKTELDIAAKIQQGIVPSKAFEDDRICVNTMMQPAKSVGGDLYDYFGIGDGKYVLAIGDVSGKGISAAMFMMCSSVIIRNYAKILKNPGEILEATNNMLCANNPQQMFVTFFLAIYDSKKGTLTYSNAGHNKPYLLSETGEEIQVLSGAGGMLLGMFENELYEDEIVRLKGGERLFLYTDGVNEALSSSNEFFGTGHLEEVLKAGKENPVAKVKEELTAFTQGAEQSDDITMLEALFISRWKLSFDSEIKNLEQVKQLILNNPFIQEKLKKKLYLAVEELFVNICSYAYPDKKGPVEVELKIAENTVFFTFIDSGIPYNPLEQIRDTEEYDVNIEIGGFGKYMAFHIMDDAHYEYKDGFNILKCKKKMEDEEK